mmetsp:Transcript_27679/g.81354  ORF Transcript_27679/g.81354 Transcript_27679/m.81354 type:complete len:85 (+) Transcript_27679:106-360(+)
MLNHMSISSMAALRWLRNIFQRIVLKDVASKQDISQPMFVEESNGPCLGCDAPVNCFLGSKHPRTVPLDSSFSACLEEGSDNGG